MRLKNFFLIGIFSCMLLSLQGCIPFVRYGLSDDTPNMLAEKLNMRKNHWYVLENNKTPGLFYNDFQDYIIIIKAPYRDSTNVMYKRDSLSQALDEVAKNIKLPPECKGICAHFLYEGKKALFFDLDAFCDRYGDNFMEFIINDGIGGFCYFRFDKPLKSCEWYIMLPSKVSYYRVLQMEPDFHLLDLSVKKRW